jgi:hypothetical protein
MAKLKASNPEEKLMTLLILSTQKWNERKEISKLRFKNVLNDINNIGIADDMCKVTNLVIKNKTDHCVNYK